MNRLQAALEKVEIPVPNKDTETFKIVRWGKNNRYWLRKFQGGYIFGDFVRGLSEHVFDKDYKGEQFENILNNLQKTRQEAENELLQINEHASLRAKYIWNEATETSEHPYLSKKKVLSHGLREYEGCLVIPLSDIDGKLWSLQFINKNSEKRFLSNGKKKGCYFLIGTLAENAFICEGYATGATVYECTGKPVVVAFDSGNLKPVVQALRKKYPKLKMILCADNDCYHESGFNPGVEKAKEAALLTNSEFVIPSFKDTVSKPTDFNDLFVLEGKDAVNAILKNPENPNHIPDGFILSDSGLFFIDKKTSAITRISNYIKIIAFLKNNGEISRLVEFKNYKGDILRTIIRPKMFTHDGDQIRIHLISKGFVFSGSLLSKRKLFEYITASIPEKEATLISKTGFFENIYIRPDRIIGEAGEKIIVDEIIRDDSYGISGNLQQWNDLIARWCIGNSRLIFAICTALASVLLKICNVQNFGFHFVGNSSSGKTTCLSVAASVFGKPNYLVSWKATDNALENIAFKHNDAPLILDELSEISPSKAGEVAYMLANGQGKKRLDKDCNARETLSWRLIFLSSGEVDLSAHMAEANKTSKAGQKVRFLNIPAKASDKSFGIFENLMGFQDGAEFADFLRSNASKYYGVISIEFIKRVLKYQNDIRKMYIDEYQKLKSQYLPKKSEGQDMRAFEKFMFVGFAGELAIKYGVICWKPNTAYQAAVACFNSWLEDKEGVGNDENRQILEHVYIIHDDII